MLLRSRGARARLIAAGAVALLVVGSASCSDEEKPAAKKGLANPEVYQAFFAHYPFGGHPVEAWTERLNALAPGGHQEDARAYTLARRRADQVGLTVSGEGQHHVVKIKSALIEQLIKKVDAMRSDGSGS